MLAASRPNLLSMRPPAPEPAEPLIAGETSRVAGAGRQVASWPYESGKTDALHRKRDRLSSDASLVNCIHMHRRHRHSVVDASLHVGQL